MQPCPPLAPVLRLFKAARELSRQSSFFCARHRPERPQPSLYATFAQSEKSENVAREFAALRGAMHENACAANRLRHETTSTRQSICSPFAPTKNRMFAGSEKHSELSRPHEAYRRHYKSTAEGIVNPLDCSLVLLRK